MRRLLEIILFIAIAVNIASALSWHGKWLNIPTGFHLTMALSLIYDYIKMNKK
jgi:hypothetical protein